MFNQIINTHELKEMKLVGTKFTWSNNIHDPTLEKLDSSNLWILGTGPSPL